LSMAKRRGFAFWVVQGPGWLLLIYLFVAQGITAFSYDLGVAMGTQEPPEMITEVGTAFWYGFAFADLVIYIPLLLAGLIGHWLGTRWGRIALAAALGITVYWTIACLAAIVAVRGAPGWLVPSETPFWVVLPTIAAWGAYALWYLFRESLPAD